MNNQNEPASGNPGSSTPPVIPTASGGMSATAALGAIPGEEMPIANVAAAIEAMLRQPSRVMFQLKAPSSGGLVAVLLAIAIVCSFVYGIVVGTFSGAE